MSVDGTRLSLGWLPGAAAFAAIVYAVAVEPRRLRVERRQVALPGLPAEADGRRIALISDLHAGMWLQGRGQIRRAVRAVIAERPDLVLIAGDITHNGYWEEGDVLAPLARRTPVLAVLGNHDHLAGPAAAVELTARLTAQGVRVLDNEHVPCGIPGLPWLVVGVDDWVTGHTDLVKAVTGIPPNSTILALLTHVPDVADHVPSQWFPLILAGHTHGIRLRLGVIAAIPWVRRRIHLARSRYPRGFYRVNQSLLYVTRGVGMSEAPLRAGSIPEVTILTLTRAYPSP